MTILFQENLLTACQRKQDKINNELAKVNPDDLSKANNYYEYTKALAGNTLQELFLQNTQKNYGAFLQKS